MGAPTAGQASAAGAPVVTIRDNRRVIGTFLVPLFGLGFFFAVLALGSHKHGATVGLVVSGIWIVLGIWMVVGALRGATRIYTDRIVYYPLTLPQRPVTFQLAGLAGVGLYEVQHRVPYGGAGTQRTRLTYEWQLVLWYADGSTDLLKSIESDANLRSSSVTEEFAHGDPILKTSAGHMAQLIYQQALAFQGTDGPLSKGAFPADDVEQNFGQPIARWTPYSGFKALGDNDDVQKYYPGAVPQSPGQVARRKEVNRRRRELSILAFFVVIGFSFLTHL